MRDAENDNRRKQEQGVQESDIQRRGENDKERESRQLYASRKRQKNRAGVREKREERERETDGQKHGKSRN